MSALPAAGLRSGRWWAARLREAWSKPELRWLVAILALAAVLRILWVAWAMREPQGLHDPIFYLGFGRAIAEGDGYWLPDAGLFKAGPTAYYPIGYPAALGGVYTIVLRTPIPDNLVLAAGSFQVFLGVATVALAYEVGRRLFSVPVGLLAALWLALFPNLIFHTGTFLGETLFNFLVLAALLALLWSNWREGLGWGRLAVFGVLLGLSMLVRPISLLFLPLLLVALPLAGIDWRRAIGYTAVATVAAAAVIAPWTLRNIAVMDAPVVISTNIGDNLCIGHFAGATGGFALPGHCFDTEEYAGGLTWDEFEVEKNGDNTRHALRFAVDHPGGELKLLSRKAYHTWEDDHDGLFAAESYGDDIWLSDAERTALARTADIFFYVTISVGALGLFGLVMRPRDARRVFFLLALLSLAGIPLVFFGDSRFHVPVMPLLAVAAAWAAIDGRRRLARAIAEQQERERRAAQRP